MSSSQKTIQVSIAELFGKLGLVLHPGNEMLIRTQEIAILKMSVNLTP